MLATRLVVVVLPWVPAIAMPCLMRISSASICARGTTGTLALARHHDFRVVLLDGGRHHHGIGRRRRSARIVADRDAYALRPPGAASWRFR
jgi:hypothetical protein